MLLRKKSINCYCNIIVVIQAINGGMKKREEKKKKKSKDIHLVHAS